MTTTWIPSAAACALAAAALAACAETSTPPRSIAPKESRMSDVPRDREAVSDSASSEGAGTTEVATFALG